MTRDRIDTSLLAVLAILVAAAVAIPFLHSAPETTPPGGRATERQLLQEARLFMIQKRYDSVEELRKSGQHQQAILKLEEIARAYPSDPHAFILRGELLSLMGAPAEAAASFAQGVKLEGGYVDRNSPLSRREAISRLVESELRNPAINSTPSRRNDVRYLQSRLAGGCE